MKSAFGAFAKRFLRDEDGSTTIWSLYIFFIMLIMAGFGLDTMRHELERSKLQIVTDTAVLAAAKSESNQQARDVLESYYDKNDRLPYLQETGIDDVNITQNSAKVSAVAQIDVKTYLMKLVDVDVLYAASAATAVANTPKLEITLVLDVSGSMGNNSKLANLKVAAKSFVSTVINSGEPGNTAIAIVPFNTSVNPTTTMRKALHVDETHEYSNCLEFRDADYGDVALPTKAAAQGANPPDAVRQAIYSSRFGGFDSLSQPHRSCFENANFTVMPFSNNILQLHSKIDSLQAQGWTTGSLGIKWGAGMLDPSFRDVTAELITAGEMSASLAAFPHDYSDSQVQKIIVMMGDGKNTTTHFFKENSNYRGADSDFYEVRYGDETRYFLRNPVSNSINGVNTPSSPATPANACSVQFPDGTWGPAGCDDVTDRGQMDDWNYIDLDTGAVLDGADFVALPDTKADFKFRRQHTWEIAWGRISPFRYSELTSDWTAHEEYNSGPGLMTGGPKNVRMETSCNAVKSKGVVVYTIGFEITKGGTAEEYLQKCASSELYYFRAEGVSISTVFSTIAGNVQALRLTQ